MWIFVPLAVLTAVATTIAVTVDARNRARRAAYNAAHRRLAAAGELPATSTVYRSANAVTVPADVREHVAPGIGSLASFAQTACDTKVMRTGAERHELDAVYDTAHDENTARDLDASLSTAWGDVRGSEAWALIDAWVAKYHGDQHYAECAHCAKALHEQSDEYALIVAERVNTDTAAWPIFVAA